MAQTSDFGKVVKIRLIEMDKTQTWLVDQVRDKTDLYFDDSYLWKVLAGKLATPKIVAAIREILNIQEEAVGE